MDLLDDTSTDNFDRRQKVRERFDEAEQRIKDAFAVLQEPDSDVADVLAHALMTEHRTHQQSILRNFHIALKTYAANTGVDLRNEAAVEWAQEVTKDNQHFPYI